MSETQPAEVHPPYEEVPIEALEEAPVELAENLPEKKAEAAPAKPERPYRDAVVHAQCKNIVILRPDVAGALHKTPGIIGTIRCPTCRVDHPVERFTWHEGGGPIVES